MLHLLLVSFQICLQYIRPRPRYLCRWPINGQVYLGLSYFSLQALELTMFTYHLLPQSQTYKLGISPMAQGFLIGGLSISGHRRAYNIKGFGRFQPIPYYDSLGPRLIYLISLFLKLSLAINDFKSSNCSYCLGQGLGTYNWNFCNNIVGQA